MFITDSDCNILYLFVQQFHLSFTFLLTVSHGFSQLRWCSQPMHRQGSSRPSQNCAGRWIQIHQFTMQLAQRQFGGGGMLHRFSPEMGRRYANRTNRRHRNLIRCQEESVYLHKVRRRSCRSAKYRPLAG